MNMRLIRNKYIKLFKRIAISIIGEDAKGVRPYKWHEKNYNISDDDFPIYLRYDFRKITYWIKNLYIEVAALDISPMLDNLNKLNGIILKLYKSGKLGDYYINVYYTDMTNLNTTDYLLSLDQEEFDLYIRLI